MFSLNNGIGLHLYSGFLPDCTNNFMTNTSMGVELPYKVLTCMAWGSRTTLPL